MNREEVVYIAVNDWFDNGEVVDAFLDKLLADETENIVSYNFEVWDMSCQYWITTTLGWLEDNGLNELLKFRCEKTDAHQEYVKDKITVNFIDLGWRSVKKI